MLFISSKVPSVLVMCRFHSSAVSIPTLSLVQVLGETLVRICTFVIREEESAVLPSLSA